MMLCWTKESLLKSWNTANAISPFATSIVGLGIHKATLKGPEAFSLIALMVLAISSNREGRQDRLPMNIKEGLYNIVLLILASFMSMMISSHLLEGGVERYLTFDAADITAGGRALWFMTIIVEYSSFMFAATFSLLFFDEARKRVSLVEVGFQIYEPFQ